MTEVYYTSKDAEFKIEKLCHQWFFLRKLYFLSFQQKTDIIVGINKGFFMVTRELQFLTRVHFHSWNGVLYKEKHFQNVKIDISWEKGTPLVKSSVFDFTTIIANHSNIYDKISVFTKLWLVYHFINGL